MGTSFFSNIRWIRINLGYKELVQAFNQTDYVMVKMKNVSISPSDFTFNILVPEKNPMGSSAYNKTGSTVFVPAQDGRNFYTRSHLSALHNCALLFSTNYQCIFIFKNSYHNLVIALCRAPVFFQKYCTGIY